MPEKTVECPICGEPYKVFSHYAGDQSTCQNCQNKAKGNNENDIYTSNTGTGK